MEGKLLYKDLSYKINGILFSVHNQLGRSASEGQYGDLLTQLLQNAKLKYEREKVLPPSFAGEKPGRNRIDFIVEDIIVIEAKAKHSIEREDYDQLLRYLQALNKKLGLLVNFHTKRLTIRRVVNPASNELANLSSDHSRIGVSENPRESAYPCLRIKIKKLKPQARLPEYAHPGDVGLDLFSLEDCTLAPGERHIFPLGFALEFPFGYAAIVKDKSSISKSGLHTFGGVFDAGYRGEYNVGLVNLSPQPYRFEKGHKLAQLIIFPVAIAEFEETDMLSATSRGAGQFGSTGK